MQLLDDGQDAVHCLLAGWKKYTELPTHQREAFELGVPKTPEAYWSTLA